MARKRQFETNLSPAQKELTLMKYADLQRGCIVRNMPFDELLKGNYHSLADYFERHYLEKFDNSRLDAFDEYVEEILRKRGVDEPYIKLGFIGEKDEDGEIISIKRPKKFRKPKVKSLREKDEDFGIWQGTKKALTMQCAKEGKSFEKTFKIVSMQFPEAKPKSCNIWFRHAIRAMKVKEDAQA